MNEEEARKAIREFGEFVGMNDMQGAVTDLALDVVGILTEASASSGVRELPSDFRFNIALHKAELMLDDRLDSIKELRGKLIEAAKGAISLALEKGLGIPS